MPIRRLHRSLLAIWLAACTADLVPAPPRVPPVDAGERPRASAPAAGKAALDPRFTSGQRDAAAVSDAGIDASPDPDDAGSVQPRDPEPQTETETEPASEPEPRAEPEPESKPTPPKDPVDPPNPTSRPTPPARTPPAPRGCITEVAPGEHIYRCHDLWFLVHVDPQCHERACGMIVDIHGNGMTATEMRETTNLHRLAPSRGYLVVHPSATRDGSAGDWTPETYAGVAAFVHALAEVFQVDRSRVHLTGFSEGADLAFWFLCNEPSLIASVAAASRAEPGADCIDASWEPPIPLLYLHGALDALTIGRARTMIEDIASWLELGTETAIESDAEYSRRRWSRGSMQLDYIEHVYSRTFSAGHCVPAGDAAETLDNLGLGASTCTIGNIRLHWGELALQWFVDHPRKAPADAGP